MWRLDPDGSPTPIYYPDEDNSFLDQIDHGYIGISQPEITHSSDKGKELWVAEDGKVSKRYVPADELKDYSPTNGDNWAGDPEQAWA